MAAPLLGGREALCHRAWCSNRCLCLIPIDNQLKFPSVIAIGPEDIGQNREDGELWQNENEELRIKGY
jgi:hypothetical protein